jgi:hypothetical protein
VSLLPRRAFRRAPLDGPLFLRTLYLQPGAPWFALALIFRPASRAAVTALGASCSGAARVAAESAAQVVYVPVVPALAAAAYYLAFARRRLDYAPHRRVADFSLAVLLAVSAANGVFLAAQAAARWPALGPELARVRADCWPGR